MGIRDDFHSIQKLRHPSNEKEPRTTYIKELLQCTIGKASSSDCKDHLSREQIKGMSNGDIKNICQNYTTQAQQEFNYAINLFKESNDDGNIMDEAILNLHRDVLVELAMMR